METTLISGTILLIIGFLAGRLSIKQGGQDSGGMQFQLGPDIIQVEGWVVRIIWREVMSPAEQAAMFIVDEMYAKGKKPSETQLAYAQNAWLSAFTRWIGTEEGRHWSTRNAPHLLGE
ncbi:hypothetical protein [Herpetosiphon geysericola]|uniref:Uncharacterized protein n=1 Tax=Herpetosiphon geysericola TaxID=70996 RepID=A0A0P6XIP3_9CHLR|nr:hypothetical protein [Herpetosiphon geysericola]KPL80013.1 hypothetical protein SE18_25875 [Herpetosiphon geysericola]